MKRVLSQCLAMVALLALTVPASAAGAREAIQSTNAKFSALFAKGDAAALSALYAKTAQSCRPEVNPLGGLRRSRSSGRAPLPRASPVSK